jgi:hypothetical protein
MAKQQTDREQIADALYMLAAGANHAVLMDTLRAFVVAHSKEEADVLALLRELQEAQPTLTVTAIKQIAKPAKKSRKPAAQAKKSKPKGRRAARQTPA